MKVAAQECLVNQELGDIRLRQTESGRADAVEQDESQTPPVGNQKTRDTPVAGEQNLCFAAGFHNASSLP